MRVISISPPQGDREVARASIEFDGGVRLHNIKITDRGVFARDASFDQRAVKTILDHVRRSPNDHRS
ncbi:MAG: hypothetical protein NTAFB05_25760 [Nitrobacter sp.]|uniref:hypothetical protein n=1 Tax=Nitrobacter sp. TaxID=29420 RepID=UPI00387DDEF8